MTTNSFKKRERIVSRKLIEQMFTGSHHSAVAYPIRMVCTAIDATPDATPVQVLISVSKRHLRHATDRNRVKRLIREAYRRNKHLIYNNNTEETGENRQRRIAMAFIWLADDTKPYDTVEQSVKKLLTHTADRIYNEKTIGKSQ